MWIKGGADDAQREQKHDNNDKAKGMRRGGVRFEATRYGQEEVTLTQAITALCCMHSPVTESRQGRIIQSSSSPPIPEALKHTSTLTALPH